MWVIPKNLSIYRSAQDMGALISDSQELSEQLEQSVLWRSKPSASKTWSRRLKVGGSTPRLYSQTLRNSLGSLLVGEWTSSLEASLVSHFQAQEEEQETKTQDTCGHTSQTESNDWGDLPLFCLKTSKASSAVSSRATTGVIQKAHRFCYMSSESWKDWVTTRRREYSQRVKLARPISESEHSSWVCVPTSGKQDAILFHQCSEIHSQVQHIPHQEAQSSTPSSPQELHSWATPNTMDHLPQRSEEALIRQATTTRKGRTAPANLREQVNPVAKQIYREVRNWATPTAGTKDHMGGSLEYYRRPSAIGKQIDINGQVLLSQWATPTSRDYKGKYPQWIQEDPTRLTRSLLPDQAHMGTYKGKLNPRWVETLMGLPVGWVMPSCANPWIIAPTSLDYSETESCQAQPSERSESCGETLTPDELYEINYDAIRKEAPELPLGIVEEEAAYAALDQYHDELEARLGLWATPPASQRGDTVEVYIRRCIKRLKDGGQPFAPTLQVCVGLAEMGLSTSSADLFAEIDLSKDTEMVVKEVLSTQKKSC